MSEFDYEIVYTKGQLHKDVDCLSRAPVTNNPDDFIDQCVYLVTPVDREDWIDDYDADMTSQDIYTKAEAGDEEFRLLNGLIYRDTQLYVPECRRGELVRNVHSSNLSIHPGAEATYARIAEDYWWPNMRSCLLYTSPSPRD